MTAVTEVLTKDRALYRIAYITRLPLNRFKRFTACPTIDLPCAKELSVLLAENNSETIKMRSLNLIRSVFLRGQYV